MDKIIPFLPTDFWLVGIAAVLLLILVVSFKARAFVFCQYLHTMTGVTLRPKEVRRVYRQKGKAGVREMFLDLMIREDLKDGPIAIPEKPLTVDP